VVSPPEGTDTAGTPPPTADGTTDGTQTAETPVEETPPAEPTEPAWTVETATAAIAAYAAALEARAELDQAIADVKPGQGPGNGWETETSIYEYLQNLVAGTDDEVIDDEDLPPTGSAS
jgi:hypothetical protein